MWILDDLASPAGPASAEPHLAADDAGLLLSWLEENPEEGVFALRFSRLAGDAWDPALTVVEGSDFFVNWADFPSVFSLGEGRLAAHWLQRGPAGGYDYGVRVAFSEDGGATWTAEPWVPHEDGTPTEHGFVSMVPLPDGGGGVVWLDGRDFASPEVQAHERRPGMAIRFRALPFAGPGGPEVVLDELTCDCCQTDAVPVPGGAIVAYRDRSPDEIRDIAVVRLENGSWTEPRIVHDDHWEIAACPVNGPALAAREESVALAWFTAAQDQPRVHLAFSRDGGRTFGSPVRVDEGAPVGRVDAELLPDGSALVSWLEGRGEEAEILVRRVEADGGKGLPRVVARTSAARASGFPQMMADEAGIVFAWTEPGDPARVRVARARLES